ncbi:NRDE family protein [Roseivirga pacifica]|uniref:NRDE family protein n=1 Tax=Roseivirga pacifica TaxID=1267423 RepID=UPI003BB1C6DA
MCTVTFLPLTEGFILTSNRDESPERQAFLPQQKRIGNVEVCFPKDPLAGGTWFATDNQRFTLCLLNGGFEKHKHEPPYRLSRGQMVLQFFEYYDLADFKSQFEFEGIEPFTLVVIDALAGVALEELVWDEKALRVRKLNSNTPYIWSSSTLYPEPVRQERRNWFEKWLLDHKTFSQQEIISFHKSGGKGDAWNDFVMNREGKVQTISVTSVQKKGREFSPLYHEDLLAKNGIKA